MSNSDKSLVNESKYVKLNLYPKRRAFIILVCSILTFFCSSWIWINLTQNRADHWFIISLPMIFIGLLTNFLAPAEEWKYGPWQESSQKYEKNIYD